MSLCTTWDWYLTHFRSAEIYKSNVYSEMSEFLIYCRRGKEEQKAAATEPVSVVAAREVRGLADSVGKCQ